MAPDIKSGTGNLRNPTHRNNRPDVTVNVDQAILQLGSFANFIVLPFSDYLSCYLADRLLLKFKGKMRCSHDSSYAQPVTQICLWP